MDDKMSKLIRVLNARMDIANFKLKELPRLPIVCNSTGWYFLVFLKQTF